MKYADQMAYAAAVMVFGPSEPDFEIARQLRKLADTAYDSEHESKGRPMRPLRRWLLTVLAARYRWPERQSLDDLVEAATELLESDAYLQAGLKARRSVLDADRDQLLKQNRRGLRRFLQERIQRAEKGGIR